MAKLVLFSVVVVVFVSSHFVKVSDAGTVAYKHQDTTLDELRSIDSYVSSALPVLQDGFFIGTARGPVLVKSEPLPGANKKRPTVNAKYYNTLPRLIPAGFEGIATSYFNLGAATPILEAKPFAELTKNFVTPSPVVAQSHPQQYVAAAAAPAAVAAVPAEPVQYLQQQTSAQSHQYYVRRPQQPQQQQYVPEIQQAQPEPQQYVSEPQHFQQQYQQPEQEYAPETQQNQFAPEAQQLQQQQPQQYFGGQEQNQQQQFEIQQTQQQQQNYQQLPQQEEARNVDQQFFRFSHHPQQYHVERSIHQPEQQLQQISEPQQYQNQQQQQPQQDQYNNNVQFDSRNQFNSPNAEPSFQVDNLLSLDKDEPSSPPQQPPQTFSRQLFRQQQQQQQERFQPNAAVIATHEFEETLPETLRNQFYKSANLANILAQESLPVQGEQIVREWDTNKIAKGKIHALLRGAGLI